MFSFKDMIFSIFIPSYKIRSYSTFINNHCYFFSNNFISITFNVILRFPSTSISTELTFRKKTKRINPHQHIWCILIKIKTTGQSNRV